MKQKKNFAVFVITLAALMFFALLTTMIILAAYKVVDKTWEYILFIIPIVLILSVLVFVWVVYNRLIFYQNKVDESLALIDIHLKLRFDLIPNLVATVKGYTKHEEKVFKEVAKLRASALETTDEKQKLEYANSILPKMKQIFVLAENYPALKTDKVFRSLIDELVDIEEKIVAARRFYDSNVNIYNTLIMAFPSNVIGSMFGFEKKELFKIDAGEKIVREVGF